MFRKSLMLFCIRKNGTKTNFIIFDKVINKSIIFDNIKRKFRKEKL